MTAVARCAAGLARWAKPDGRLQLDTDDGGETWASGSSTWS
jgi:hypothetical protein